MTHAAERLFTDPPGTSSAQDQALQWHHQLRAACTQLGMPSQEADRILTEEALQMGGVEVALRLNTPAQQGEFYADCGLCQPWQAADVYQHVLEDALVNDLPAINIALHPQSQHLVARACLPLATLDDQGWLCTAMLLATVTRALETREQFSLRVEGHR